MAHFPGSLQPQLPGGCGVPGQHPGSQQLGLPPQPPVGSGVPGQQPGSQQLGLPSQPSLGSGVPGQHPGSQQLALPSQQACAGGVPGQPPVRQQLGLPSHLPSAAGGVHGQSFPGVPGQQAVASFQPLLLPPAAAMMAPPPVSPQRVGNTGGGGTKKGKPTPKPPSSNPSNRVRKAGTNTPITAVCMDKLEESHADAILNGLHGTQFNAISLRRLSPQDKVDCIGWLTGQWGEARPVGSNQAALVDNLLREFNCRVADGRVPRDFSATRLVQWLREERRIMEACTRSLHLADHGGALAVGDGRGVATYVRPAASQVPWQREIRWDRVQRRPYLTNGLESIWISDIIQVQAAIWRSFGVDRTQAEALRAVLQFVWKKHKDAGGDMSGKPTDEQVEAALQRTRRILAGEEPDESDDEKKPDADDATSGPRIAEHVDNEEDAEMGPSQGTVTSDDSSSSSSSSSSSKSHSKKSSSRGGDGLDGASASGKAAAKTAAKRAPKQKAKAKAKGKAKAKSVSSAVKTEAVSSKRKSNLIYNEATGYGSSSVQPPRFLATATASEGAAAKKSRKGK